jgi:hypothetical protein
MKMSVLAIQSEKAVMETTEERSFNGLGKLNVIMDITHLVQGVLMNTEPKCC